MARDYTLEVRQAVVSRLKQQMTTLPAASIHGERVPANPSWPFIRYSSTTLPWEASCYDGSQVSVSVHVFTSGPSTDEAARIAAEVVEVLEGLPAGDATWTGNIGPITDEGPDKWHIVVGFRVIWS